MHAFATWYWSGPVWGIAGLGLGIAMNRRYSRRFFYIFLGFQTVFNFAMTLLETKP